MIKKIISVLLILLLSFNVMLLIGCDKQAAKTKDIVIYTSKKYPSLSIHAQFLFLDADGKFRPNDALTADEFAAALNALSTANGDNKFKSTVSGEQAVTYKQFVDVLNKLFDTEIGLDSVNMTEVSENTLKRADFAKFMCSLLQRADNEKVDFTNGKIPSDVSAFNENVNYILEASVAHEIDENGVTWESADLPTGLNKGFNNVDGWLYYVDDDGFTLKNKEIGLLNFGADGKYTTGDKDLDKTVAGVLSEIIDANPKADRFSLLRKAYEYSRDEFKYRRRFDANGNHDVYAVGDTGWEITDAKNMFKEKAGNCYCFAAVFWALARGLGYDARAISGTCLQDYQPHGWVIIEMDGKDYIFDPEWEWAYRNEREIFDKDMFKIPLDKATWWNYRWDKSQ